MIGLVRFVARATYEDMVASAQAVRASDADWTIVRLPFPTDDPATGRVEAGLPYRDCHSDLARGRSRLRVLCGHWMSTRPYKRIVPGPANAGTDYDWNPAEFGID
jgi:hypothetical protein